MTYIAILGVVLLGFHGSCVQPSSDIDNCCDERALRGMVGINNFENQLSGKSHCSQNVCLLPDGSERKIKFHIYGPDPRGYSVQASFKYGLGS